MSRKNRILLSIFVLSILILILFIWYSFFMRNKVKSEYDRAIVLIDNNDYESYISAKDILKSIGDYKDSYKCINKIEETLSIYDNVKELINNRQYETAIIEVKKILNFDNSEELLLECKYKYAEQLLTERNYELAYQYFRELGDYLLSNEHAENALLQSMSQKKEQLYTKAEDYIKEKDFLTALKIFEEFNDSDQIEECKRMIAKQMASTLTSGIHYSVAIKDSDKEDDKKKEIICTDSRYKFEGWEDIISVSGFGPMIIGLNEDGTVMLEEQIDKDDSTGKDVCGIDISDWENIVQVSAGQQHVVGLKEDGSVVSSGHNIKNVLATGNWKGIKCIDAGWFHTVGIDSSNNIHVSGYKWDEFEDEFNDKKQEWKNVIAISTGGGSGSFCGDGHIVGLCKNGTVVAIGDNDYGQCNVYGEEWANIVAISAGDFHTVGLKSDGTVVATEIPSDAPVPKGEIDKYRTPCNVYGKKWEGIVAISAGYGTTLGLNEDGEVVVAGFDIDFQTPKDYEWTDIVRYDEWRSMKSDD